MALLDILLLFLCVHTMIPMKYHVYIWLETLSRQLATSIDLPDDAMALTNSELNGLIRTQVDPIALGDAFKDYRIDGLREHDDLPPPPPPAWLVQDDTKNAFPNHHPIFGSALHYQWSQFLGTLLSNKWADTRDWIVGPSGLGYPNIPTQVEKSYVPYRRKHAPLVEEVPSPWQLMPNLGQGHLGLHHPSIVVPNLTPFLSLRAAKPLFPAQTHPLFCVALYEFWKYLHAQPLWAYLPSSSIITDNRTNADWTPETMMGLGLSASVFRWGWWSMLNHAFPPHSRALDILMQHYPDSHSNGDINPCPLGMELSPELCTFPPKLRIFIDPLGR